MSLYYWLIVVTALPCEYFAQTLKQIVPSIAKDVSKIAIFKCEVEGVTIRNSYPLHWYQHKPGQVPTQILYYGSGTSRDPGFGERFKAGKSKDNEFYLIIDKVKTEDTATYYCARWTVDRGAVIKIFGAGTKLFVTGKSVSTPKIQIFPPNITDLEKDNRAPVVCLLTDFFPGVIRVQWTIGDKKAPDDDVLTDAAKENGNYSVISRLTITKLDWNSKDIHCKAEHETNPGGAMINKDSRIAIQKPDDIPAPTCQPSVQNISTIVNEGQPLSSLKLATFTYTLLLVKSVVYCGIISILYRLEHRDVKKPL
ncbi:immunoglobulin kappa light chain-like [Rhincodon typus]|uniref:immunoglobulin kappa light chain-like n=1 Tax=Rhincodon typus TaxID=259920 RepID=UPI002030ADEA|nr:immunoglobulin kappa light chain-like [Rhincodon typus]